MARPPAFFHPTQRSVFIIGAQFDQTVTKANEILAFFRRKAYILDF